MRRINAIFALLLLSAILVSNFDKPYQINKVFKEILSSSETDENIYLQYGPGLKELVDLHTQEGYSRPYLSSYVNIYGNQVVACVSVEKYVEEGETSKQMIAKESTYFRVQFQRLPLVNIDLLKRVIPEN